MVSLMAPSKSQKPAQYLGRYSHTRLLSDRNLIKSPYKHEIFEHGFMQSSFLTLGLRGPSSV